LTAFQALFIRAGVFQMPDQKKPGLIDEVETFIKALGDVIEGKVHPHSIDPRPTAEPKTRAGMKTKHAESCVVVTTWHGDEVSRGKPLDKHTAELEAEKLNKLEREYSNKKDGPYELHAEVKCSPAPSDGKPTTNVKPKAKTPASFSSMPGLN
jgi:hypothetical protein